MSGKFLGKKIVLGVTGSIAAYKAVNLLRRLIEEGADVRVVMTASAARFVGPVTLAVLSRHEVASDLFGAGDEMLHLTLSEEADAMVIAPATAHAMAKCALGLADDLLSTMALAARCPILMAPAMDGGMWDHPAVRTHAAALRARGVTLIGPEDGPLASGKAGPGRLADEAAIMAAVEACLAPRRDFTGQRVLVSAGPTQEAIDPVRFISNRSSGKMGYAIAQAARERGAEVVLVSGPTALPGPAGVELVPVCTAEEMAKALSLHLRWASVVIMAAAVADFRPARPSNKKMKKHTGVWETLPLAPTADILTALSAQRTSQLLVGFAAETENVLAHAKDKLARKGLDLIVGNNVAKEGSGFGSETSAAVLISRTGAVTRIPVVPKRILADRILDCVKSLKSPVEGPRQARGRKRDPRP